MLFENTIVGPIHSRRLGSSLGVNLLPLQHKYCSYDCVYCECGWNKESEHGQLLYATVNEIEEMLENRLKELIAERKHVDSFTFAGNGEPTLYPHFAQAADMVRHMRDLYYPNAAVTLLTNATQLKHKDVFEAIAKLDNPILKLDAGTERMRQLINRNNEMGCSWDELLELLIRFGSRGIIQTLLFDGVCEGEKIGNTSDDEFGKYVEIVKKINPRYVMLYALDRPAPAKGLRKLDSNELEKYAAILRNEGVACKVYA